MTTLKQKIAFFLPSLTIGGVERVFITYANTLCQYCDQVEFVLCKKEGALLEDLSPKVTVHDLGGVRLAKSYARLRSYLKKNRPDFIISGSDYPNMMLILASLGLSTKVIISQHNYFNIEIKQLGLFAKFTKLWMKMLYPFAYRIIAVSEGIKQFLIEELKQDASQIVRIYNPIDFEDIKAKAAEDCSFDLPETYITFIGRLSVVKNLPLLLDAFDKAEIGDCKLLIVGDGIEYQNLSERVSGMKKKDKVVFLGPMSNPLPVLKKASVLALPSFSEAFPTILLEALCLKTSVVATPTKGATEILRNVENAYISNNCTHVDEFASLLESAIHTVNNGNEETIQQYECHFVCNELIHKCQLN